ncbi:carbonic anhydrase [Psychroflexus tropicus]|uniref:carbonic anhydrase n=1 Tax=Psychroflexus tropicus TaxID=197345 RepID=UPI0003752440|nr:carbonic anhydrase family protein [Psychroflexus tropicus]
MNKLILSFSALFLIIGCQQSAEEHKENKHNSKHWSYDGETGPEHWAELEGETNCNGNFQSPINLVNFKTAEDLEPVDLHYAEETLLHDVVNNGHSIQYDFEHGDFLIHKQDTFHLKQFHFHEPAEHLIEGVRYPLEIHLVHQNSDTEFLVLSVMVKEGQNSKPFELLESYLPIQKGETKLIQAPFDMSQNLPDQKGYFTYQGSLTTPPCSEDVTWIVFKKPIEIALEQVELLRYLMPINNYRDEQPHHGRVIYSTSF